MFLNVNSNSTSSSTTIDSSPVPNPAPATMLSTGMLSPCGDGQLYTNQDLGIELTVPSSVVIGKTISKNFVTFLDIAAADK